MSRKRWSSIGVVLVLFGLLSINLGGVDSEDSVAFALQPSGIEVGDIIFEDDFSNTDGGWRIDSFFGFDWGYAEEDQEYRVFLTAPQFIAHSPSPYVGSMSNPVVISADVKHRVTGSLASVGALGLTLYTTDGSRYYFMITPAHEGPAGFDVPLRSFRVWQRLSSGSSAVVTNWTPSDAINDVNQFNELAVVIEGGKTTFYINDEDVFSFGELIINNGGVAGRTFTGLPNMNARFDNFQMARVEGIVEETTTSTNSEPEARSETPLTGVWVGPDSDDGSEQTVALIQQGNDLLCLLWDSELDGSPGFKGIGSGSALSSGSTGECNFSFSHPVGTTFEASATVAVSGDSVSIDFGDAGIATHLRQPPGDTFTGIWIGPDQEDNSIQRFALIQFGDELLGYYADEASGEITPGWTGPGTGFTITDIDAEITVDQVRGDGSERTRTFSLTMINSRNTLRLGGLPTFDMDRY